MTRTNCSICEKRPAIKAYNAQQVMQRIFNTNQPPTDEEGNIVKILFFCEPCNSQLNVLDMLSNIKDTFGGIDFRFEKDQD